MQLSIDDLPAPLGPMMARISPLAMSKLMSLSAFTPPNDRLMFSTDSRTSLKERVRVMGTREQQPHPEEHAEGVRLEGWASDKVRVAHPSRRALTRPPQGEVGGLLRSQ